MDFRNRCYLKIRKVPYNSAQENPSLQNSYFKILAAGLYTNPIDYPLPVFSGKGIPSFPPFASPHSGSAIISPELFFKPKEADHPSDVYLYFYIRLYHSGLSLFRGYNF